jgi:hypothetical protein
VVAAQHEGQESRSPPGTDLVTSGVELLAWRCAVGEHAVADVGQRQILEVAVEDRRVRLDGIRREAEIARAGVGALAEVDAALEGDAVDDDAGLVEARFAGDEPG